MDDLALTWEYICIYFFLYKKKNGPYHIRSRVKIFWSSLHTYHLTVATFPTQPSRLGVMPNHTVFFWSIAQEWLLLAYSQILLSVIYIFSTIPILSLKSSNLFWPGRKSKDHLLQPSHSKTEGISNVFPRVKSYLQKPESKVSIYSSNYYDTFLLYIFCIVIPLLWLSLIPPKVYKSYDGLETVLSIYFFFHRVVMCTCYKSNKYIEYVRKWWKIHFFVVEVKFT